MRRGQGVTIRSDVGRRVVELENLCGATAALARHDKIAGGHVAEISQTGDQMLSVLERIAADGPVSAASLAQACGLNRTVTYRLVATLAQRGYVRRTAQGYVLGPMLHHLGRAAGYGVTGIARPVMEALSALCHETVVLHVKERDEAVVIDQVTGEGHVVRVEQPIGSRHSLCRGASSWAILAFQDEAFIARILSAHPEVTDGPERIASVRRDGIAITNDELKQGVHGLSAPIFGAGGRCESSLTILVPSSRAQALTSLQADLLEASDRISQELQAGHPSR